MGKDKRGVVLGSVGAAYVPASVVFDVTIGKITYLGLSPSSAVNMRADRKPGTYSIKGRKVGSKGAV